MQLKRELRHAFDLSLAISTLAEVDRLCGDFPTALRYNQKALSLLSAENWSSGQSSWTLCNAAQLLLRSGQIQQAEERLEEIARLFQGDPVLNASCLAGLAGVAAVRGNGLRATCLLGACARLLDDEGVPHELTDEADRAYHKAAARALIDAESWDAASAEGWAMSVDEAVAYGLQVGDDG